MTRQLEPDVVLMDVRMRHDGIEATAQIVSGGFASRVLILTTFDLDEYALPDSGRGKRVSAPRTFLRRN